MTPRLSKSRIQSGRQCHKRLWLELNQPDKANWGASAQARLEEGTRFGELARELLGGGLLIEADHLHLNEALAQTQAALAQAIHQVPMLFEPAFSHEDVRVRVDALARGAHGNTLIEVKSTTAVKPEHVWDCAIQTWVLLGAGCAVNKIVLAHVNKQFVYTTPGDYAGLLVQADITDAVQALLPAVNRVVQELKSVASASMPAIQTGEHCALPYGCPFKAHCQSGEAAPPEYPLDILPRASTLVAQLRSQGYRDLRDVPEAALVSPLHKMVASVTRSGNAYVSDELQKILTSIPYPRWFLDFETVSFVIPRWLGTRPFQALPFQFSCHLETASGAISHSEFLDLSGDSPLASFVDHLIDAVADNGPILVWSQSFESSRLRELATMFPAKSGALLTIADRLVDLLPLYRAHYYHCDMRGSWTIKAVLPTLAPDLAYSTLEIGDGMQAQAGYLRAIDTHTSDTERTQLRSKLLAYCERDTLAMVRLMGTSSGTTAAS